MACSLLDSHASSSRLPITISTSSPLPLNPSKIMPEVPPEIVADILCRLPARPLMRFRCVSRRWCCLIDSHDFIKMHFNQAHKSSRSYKLILGFLGTSYINFRSPDRAYPLYPPFSASDVSNSVNGLILVSSHNDSPSVIWNPFSRKYRTVPKSLVEFPEGIEITSDYTRYGFGYDSVNDDYKVLRAVEFRNTDFQWIGTEAKVYSLKSNSWRKINNYPQPLPRSRSWGIHVNGALHNVIPAEILGFDLATEKFYRIPLPECKLVGFSVAVVGLGGCLCLTITKKRTTDIWIMKEYGVKESWTKLLSVAPPRIDLHMSVFPMAYSDDGNEVLLNLNEERLVWFDLKMKTMKEVNVQGLPFRFHAELCVETLISPDGFREGDQSKKPDVQEKKCVKKTRRKRNDFLSEGFKLVL